MWIVVTLLATCFQIARTSEQHRLRGVLNVSEAGYVRFVYALPLAVAILSIWVLGPGTLPSPNLRFFVSAVGGAIAQILATVALLHSFRLRDFAVGTIYAKSEPLFIGIASALLLDEPLAPLGWLGVLICITGVIWLTASGNLSDHRIDPAAIFGVLAASDLGSQPSASAPAHQASLALLPTEPSSLSPQSSPSRHSCRVWCWLARRRRRWLRSPELGAPPASSPCFHSLAPLAGPLP
ncbi:MAG: EamA family transporter [Acidimicrobiales bacterium]